MPEARKRRILVVEDDPLNAKFISLSLRRRGGHQVEVCEDPERVLDLARRGAVDLIIMDIQLPKLSGLEATRRLPRSTGHGSA